LVIVYAVLVVCAAVACAAARMVYRELKADGDGEPKESVDGVSKGADYWYSARRSQGWVSLGLSFFASSMGAWVLFAAPEVGIYSGWWGTLGYAFATVAPFGAVAILGPAVLSRFSEGFCLTDWVRERFGRATQAWVAIISLFYMWIALVAELTSMGNLIASMAGLDPLHALLPVSIATMLYTSLAGLPASIWTDRLQGVTMTGFIIVTVIACFSSLKVGNGEWRSVATWNDKGFESFVTLIFAIIGAGLFDMGTWQRVYAASGPDTLRKGCAFGTALIFPTMILFGLTGMLAQAQALTTTGKGIAVPALGYFDLLGMQSSGFSGLAFALGVCMVASSVDSLQTGLLSVLSREILAKKLSPTKSLVLGQLFLVVVNVVAIIVAVEGTKNPELGTGIINLFLIADLLALSIAVPVFMGLGSLATEAGALAGCASGLLFIMGFGWVEFGTFMAGLEMVTLMAFGNVKPPEMGLGASRTCIIFFLLPAVTGVVTYVVSWMDRVATMFSANGLKGEAEKPVVAPAASTSEAEKTAAPAAGEEAKV